MRIVDADEFIQRIKPYNTDDKMDKALYNFAFNKIMATPTLDAKIVVHGKWITKEGREEGYDLGGYKTWFIQIKCNQCDFIKTVMEGYTGHYNYCPNCGAKMEDTK